MHFTSFFLLFDMNPIAPRNTKIANNFGLPECNRVKRKTQDIKIIFLQYFLIFSTVKSRYMHSEKKSFVFF